MSKKDWANLLLSIGFILSLNLPPAFALDSEDPAADLLSQDQAAASETGDQRYTSEEFSVLSDDEKRDIYRNSPQLLPDDFEPESYLNIFYPESEVAE